MADDIIIARFSAELDGIRAELDKYIQSLEKVQKEEKDTQVEAKKSADAVGVTAKKRTDSIKGTTTELKKVEAASKGAFSSKPVEGFNKEVNKAQQNVKGIGGSLSGVSGSIKASLAGIGAGIIAAFSIQAVTQFAKASIDAFIEAETIANRLKFAITTVGGESEAVFDRLIKQSNELQNITIFSDDSIQNAQAALKNFGLTGAEIEKLIPLLADFATVSGQSIEQAAQAVGGGLEGLGREFKRYQIEVSATATRQENLNSLLEGFGKFSGAAEEDAKTLGGQLAVLNNRTDELQETIGSSLAPAFIKAKLAVFEAGVEFLKFLGIIDEKKEIRNNRIDSLTTSFENLAQRIKETGGNVQGQFGEQIDKITLQISEVTAKNEQLTKSIEDRIEVISRSTSNINPSDDKAIKSLTKQREGNQNVIDILNDKVKALQSVIDRENDLGKVLDNQKEASDVRTASLEAEINSLEKLTADSLTSIERIYLASLKGVQSFRDQVRIEQDAANKQTVDDFENTLNELNQKRVDANKDSVPFPTVKENDLQKFLDANAEIIAASQELIGELTNLYDAYANSQLARIEKEKEAQISAIDTQLEANENALKLRRISEREAAVNEQKLLDEKVKAEESAAKKERDIKRRQFILDKAAALIEIAIETAKNVAKNPPPNPLGVLALVTGAIQAGIVAAQPNPYKRGTKSAKGGLSLVGEEGPELTVLPRETKVVPARQTRHYSKMIDAMIDNQLEPYISKHYVAPQLEKQRKKYEDQKSKDFTDQLSKSIVLNMTQGGKGDFYLEKMSKRGVSVNNLGDLATAFKDAMQQDIYRR